MASDKDRAELPRDQSAYWDRAAGEKTFGHPLRLGRFAPLLPQDARVLDLGCGYGRLCHELGQAGFSSVVGIDSSRAMVERGLCKHPELDLRVLENDELPFEDADFDAVLVFSVLTCIPGRSEQARILAEVRRVLRPDGILYISDLPLQEDERNRSRYAEGAARYGDRGVFELPEGVVLTHIDLDRLPALLSGFSRIELEFLELETMNKNAARAFQWIGRKL